MEPFSTSVFKVLIWIFATTTKICTRVGFTPAHAASCFTTTPRPPTHWSVAFAPMVRYRSITSAPSIFRASSFGRWVVTHSLADSDFHGHRPAVYMNQHLLWDLMSGHSGTLTSRSVHPASPELLTSYGPLTTSIRLDTSLKQVPVLTHLKFENRSRSFRPRSL